MLLLIDSIETMFSISDNDICEYMTTIQEYLLNARSKSGESEFDVEWNDEGITDIFKAQQEKHASSWIGFLYMLFLERNLDE